MNTEHEFENISVKNSLHFDNTIKDLQVFQRGEFKDWKSLYHGKTTNIFRVKHSSLGEVALKYVSDHKTLLKEISVVQKLSPHPLICKLFGTLEENKKIKGYVMEYIRGGSLHDVILDKSYEYGTAEVATWSLQIAQGISFLHENNLLHKDIKPQNILFMDNRLVLKMCDFGNVCSIDDPQDPCGTLPYRPPELLAYSCIDGPKADKSADIYSFGICIYEIACRRMIRIDEEKDVYDTTERMLVGERPKLLFGKAESMPVEIKSLIS